MATLIEYHAIPGVVRAMTMEAQKANEAVRQIFTKLNVNQQSVNLCAE